MQFLTDWISNIILLILLATILELLLPNSSLQRYVKMVVGLLLLMVILNPLFSILSKDADSWIDSIDLTTQFDESELDFLIESKKKEIQRAQLAYISEQVAVQLKRQVEEEMITKFEKEIKEVTVVLSDFLDEDDYLNSITNVFIHLKAIPNDQQLVRNEIVEAVSLVTINTTEQNQPLQNEAKNKQEISHFLATQWQIPIDKIEVGVEGGRLDQ
ncbi:stage III sporulation protein AF [Bacillaceae bacterium IKA-2]|nr:stage III sporulation protein AF [Bacillaceae bacterium IKA-2]